MRILVIGSGGREHALVWKLKQSPRVTDIIVAPGNGGMAREGVRCIDVDVSDILGLAKLARSEKVDLVVPGPELPLTLGISNAMTAAGVPCFGPDRYCAQLEGSKFFAKDLMGRAGVPTAACAVFEDADAAKAFVQKRGAPLVVKADGLAAGKGVIVAQTTQEALDAVSDIMEKRALGEAGSKIVIEECLVGEEASLLCFCDGKTAVPLSSAQDHKAAWDGDKGPNTGGMGAYTGLPFITEADKEFAYKEIMCKAASAMVAEGLPLSGVLYGGLMKTPQGIKVIEFNARFGDPETEVVLPLLQSDIYDIFEGVATAREVEEPVWADGVTLGVVLASKGYPGHYEKGIAINGMHRVGTQVYHMGTALKDGQLVTNGGRVLMVIAAGSDLSDARRKVYAEVEQIQCDNLFYRKDIAHIAFE